MKLTGTFAFTLEPLGPFKFVSTPYTLALGPIETAQSQRKLVAWWTFDETEGDAASDSSGNDHGGTLVGGPQWQPAAGKTGGALAFDGVDDFIDCGQDKSLNLTEAVSVAAWIKLTGPAKEQKIIGNQDNVAGGYKLGIYDNKLGMEIRDSGNVPATSRFVEGGTVLQPGVWHHIVGTYCQGGSIKIYVNGKLDRQAPTPAILAASAGTLKIGREPFENKYWFNGLLDDLQIYDYPLSDAQVAALYSGKTPQMIAQAEPGGSRNWIAVSIVVIVALGVGLATRRKKAAA